MFDTQIQCEEYYNEQSIEWFLLMNEAMEEEYYEEREKILGLLEQYAVEKEMLKFRGKASCIDPKKGKGSYQRKAKYKENYCFI